MITPELKDSILKELIEVPHKCFRVGLRETSKSHNIDSYTLEIILDYFEQKGFLSQKKLISGCVDIYMKVPAYDFYMHGGFVGQEELLTKNIQKLLLEIESLKPSIPDRVSTITTIVGNIATALSLFVK
jgi:hypothetical protein